MFPVTAVQSQAPVVADAPSLDEHPSGVNDGEVWPVATRQWEAEF
jgi:hypothetical protein